MHKAADTSMLVSVPTAVEADTHTHTHIYIYIQIHTWDLEIEWNQVTTKNIILHKHEQMGR